MPLGESRLLIDCWGGNGRSFQSCGEKRTGTAAHPRPASNHSAYHEGVGDLRR